jgi:hypothetical protein
MMFCLLTNSACITMMTVRNAKSLHHYYSPVHAIRSAVRSGSTVAVEIEMANGGADEPSLLSVPIALDRADWGLGDPGYNGILWCGKLRVTVAAPPRAVMTPLVLPTGAQPVPVNRFFLSFVCDLEEYIEGLPPGLQVIALAPQSRQIGGRLDPPEVDHFPRVDGSFVIVVRDSTEEGTRVLYVPFVHEKQKYHRYLYPLTPLTVAADVVTSPIQLICLIIFGSGVWE